DLAPVETSGPFVKAREDPTEKFGNALDLAAGLLDEVAGDGLLVGNHPFPARRLVTSQVDQIGRDIGREHAMSLRELPKLRSLAGRCQRACGFLCAPPERRAVSAYFGAAAPSSSLALRRASCASATMPMRCRASPRLRNTAADGGASSMALRYEAMASSSFPTV